MERRTRRWSRRVWVMAVALGVAGLALAATGAASARAGLTGLPGHGVVVRDQPQLVWVRRTVNRPSTRYRALVHWTDRSGHPHDYWRGNLTILPLPVGSTISFRYDAQHPTQVTEASPELGLTLSAVGLGMATLAGVGIAHQLRPRHRGR